MIEYHADDYGLFPEQSRHIIDCYRTGALNGISIMPNSPYLKECMDEIADIRGKLLVTVHLNIVEGKPLMDDKVPRLIDKLGNFNDSFVKLFFISYIPVLRLFYRRELKKEIAAQIKACEPYMNGDSFRIDGHVHYHMIPVVFDALMDVIKEKELKVSYIRFPREEISVYQKAKKNIKDVKLLNIVKVMVLNCLVRRNQRKYAEELAGMNLERKMFMGVMLSGHMFYENVKALLPIAADTMADKGFNEMEVLFHPGDVSLETDIIQLTSKDDREFLTSSNRLKEAEALKKLGSNLKR